MAGYHWYAKGDGLVLSTLSFKEGINEDEVDDLVDDCQAPDELKGVFRCLECYHDDEVGYVFMIPYGSRIERHHPTNYFTLLEVATVIHGIFKDVLLKQKPLKPSLKKMMS